MDAEEGWDVVNGEHAHTQLGSSRCSADTAQAMLPLCCLRTLSARLWQLAGLWRGSLMQPKARHGTQLAHPPRPPMPPI